MKKFILTAKTTGTAWAEVEAANKEEALAMANEADWRVDDWDLETESYRGGFLEADEIE